MSRGLFGAVEQAIREAASTAIVPRFRSPTPQRVSHKGPNDPVTDADRHSEEILTSALADLDPGVPVIGEEAAAADPQLLSDLPRHQRCWLVDPLDGTKSFIAGDPNIATMVALVESGETAAAFIWQPIHEHMYTAVRGQGATRDGQPLHAPWAAPASGALRGVHRTTYMPPPWREEVIAALEDADLPPTDIVAAGATYPMLVDGDLDYALYWRTLPWDHAPGALLAQETGLVVKRLDGSLFGPTDGRFGLLTAASQEVWNRIRSVLPEPPER